MAAREDGFSVGEATATLREALRRVSRLRQLYAATVFACGVLVACGLTVVVVDAALVAALLVARPAEVLPVAQAVLSTAAVLAGIYAVAFPLKRNLALERFIALLTRDRGREGFVLTACELARQETSGSGPPGPAPMSPALAHEVGRRALDELSSLPFARLPGVRQLGPVGLAVLSLVALSLAAGMAWPDTLKAAAVRLLEEPVSPEGLEAQVAAGPGRAVARERQEPPCRDVRVVAYPPAYLADQAPKPLPWDQRARVPAGSTLEVLCDPARRDASLVLVRHEKQQVVSVRFEKQRQQGTSLPLLSARSPLARNAVFFVRRSRSAASQPGRLEVVVEPDLKPACALFSPSPASVVDPQGSVSVLAEALDDYGVASVTLYYKVLGLDMTAVPIELARPTAERRVLVQQQVPASLFLADPGDDVTLYVEVTDTNAASGPSRCVSAPVTIHLSSPQASQREVIEGLAKMRDRSLDLVARVMEAAATDPVTPEARDALYAALKPYHDDLSALSAHMEATSLFKGDDSRRLAALAGSLLDLLEAEDQADSDSRRRAALGQVQSELEQHAANLDGVVDKLLGEYLFQQSGRLQQELSSVRSLAREQQLDAAAATALVRAVRRLNRLAASVVALRQSVLPPTFALFTPVSGGESQDRFSSIITVTEQILASATSGPEAWRDRMDALSLAVEGAVRLAEGAYAQSMSRLSSSFRNSRDQVEAWLTKASAMNQALRKELEAVMTEVEKETGEYIKRKRTLATVQEAAHKLRSLAVVARRFNPAIYPAVDRKQVAEFRQKLAEASQLVGLLRIEEALALATDLASLTQSMEFSIDVTVRYSQDAALAKKCEREKVKIQEARYLLAAVTGKLSGSRPHRENLVSLRPDRLAGLTAQVDEMLALLEQVDERVSALKKTFPIFFGRIAPAVERLVESTSVLKADLASLMLDEAYRKVLFAQESLSRLEEDLAAAAGEGKGTGVLAAGSSSSDLDVRDKGETVPRNAMDSYLRLAAFLAQGGEWERISRDYFLLLTR